MTDTDGGALSFSLTFEGEPQEIDARTLLGSLNAIDGLIQELSAQDPLPDEFKLKVRANRPGSFIVDLVLSPDAIEAARWLFSAENIAYAGGVISGLVGLFNLRKLLKKEPPGRIKQEGKSVLVSNSEGATIVVDNRTVNLYANNQTVSKLLDQNFSTLTADPNIERFSVADSTGAMTFEASRTDFTDMVAGDIVSDDEDRTIIERVMLNIVKPSFEKHLKWKFVYRGARIGAAMGDEKFIHRIEQRRESFAQGDLLEVELEIHQEYDHGLMTYLNKYYRVSKVYNHISAGKQSNLDFESGEASDTETDSGAPQA